MNINTTILTFRGENRGIIKELFSERTFEKIIPMPKDADREWREDNWGVTTNPIIFSMTDKDDRLVVSFETYSIPPEGILLKLFEICEEEDIDMECRYDAEGFGVGTITYKNGELIDDYTLLEDL